MAHIRLKPGWVQRIIRGDIMEPVEMQFCGICRLWHVEPEHNLKYHTEPVEPEIKESKIAGLLTY